MSLFGVRQNIRDQTKELEKANRALSSTLNRVHSTPSSQGERGMDL